MKKIIFLSFVFSFVLGFYACEVDDGIIVEEISTDSKIAKEIGIILQQTLQNDPVANETLENSIGGLVPLLNQTVFSYSSIYGFYYMFPLQDADNTIKGCVLFPVVHTEEEYFSLRNVILKKPVFFAESMDNSSISQQEFLFFDRHFRDWRNEGKAVDTCFLGQYKEKLFSQSMAGVDKFRTKSVIPGQYLYNYEISYEIEPEVYWVRGELVVRMLSLDELRNIFETQWNYYTINKSSNAHISVDADQLGATVVLMNVDPNDFIETYMRLVANRLALSGLHRINYTGHYLAFPLGKSTPCGYSEIGGDYSGNKENARDSECSTCGLPNELCICVKNFSESASNEYINRTQIETINKLWGRSFSSLPPFAVFAKEYMKKEVEYGKVLNYNTQTRRYYYEEFTNDSYDHVTMTYRNGPTLYSLASMHNHPRNNPPSFSDLTTFLKEYKETKKHFTTSFIVGNSGDLYALGICDSEKAIMFNETIPNGNEERKSFTYSWNERWKQIFKEMITDELYEASKLQEDEFKPYVLAYLLQEKDTGVMLLQCVDGTYSQLYVKREVNALGRIIYTRYLVK